MNKISTFALLVTVLLLNQACKATTAATSSATPTPTPTVIAIPGSSADVIAHTFTNACIGGGSISSKAAYAFTNSTAGVMTEYYYSDGSCTTPMFFSMMPFTYTVGAINSTSGRFDINFTGGDTLLTPTTSTGTNMLNTQVTNNVTGICGLTNWVTGTSKNMTTIGCTGEQLIPASTTRYSSVWLTGSTGSMTLTLDTASRTGCGGNMDTSSGTRCTTISTNSNETLLQTQ